MYRTRHGQGDVLDAVDAQRGLAERFGVAHLVEAFVFALVEVHDVAGGRSADHDDRESVDGGFQQRRQSVEESRRRHGQRHRRPGVEKAFGGGRIDRVGLMPHTDIAHAHALRDACEIGDGNADHAIHVADAVRHQRLGKVMRRVRDGLVLFFCHRNLHSY